MEKKCEVFAGRDSYYNIIYSVDFPLSKYSLKAHTLLSAEHPYSLLLTSILESNIKEYLEKSMYREAQD